MSNRQHGLRGIPARDETDALDALLHSGYRYALSLARDPSEAEDILQEACIGILAARGRWDKPYLFAAIRNRFIDHYRRNQRILFVPLDGGEESIPDDGDDGTGAITDAIQSDTLGRALAALPVEERETLYLAAVEGFTAQEIADFTDRPRGTVLSLLHRTKRKLRQLLEEGGGNLT